MGLFKYGMKVNLHFQLIITINIEPGFFVTLFARSCIKRLCFENLLMWDMLRHDRHLRLEEFTTQ